MSSFANKDICPREKRCLATSRINIRQDWSTLCSIDVGVVSGLPGAKVRRGTKDSFDPSQMYAIPFYSTTRSIGLPTTMSDHLNR